MFLLFLIFLLLLLLIILFYLEIPRYYKTYSSNWKTLKKLDQQYHLKPRADKKRIIISLTTIPDRIDKIAPTLCSLLSQTKRVDEIRLNIPYKTLKNKSYNIPPELLTLKHVKIYRTEKDWGPATKLLPSALDENKTTKIIVVDDDNIYGSKVVENLARTFRKRNCREVITNYGSDIRTGSLKRIFDYFYVRTGKYVERLFGCGGYILIPAMLPPEIYNYKNAPKSAIYVDDNWISGWLNYNYIKIFLIGRRSGCTFFPSIKCISTISLSKNTNQYNTHETEVNKFFKKKGVF